MAVNPSVIEAVEGAGLHYSSDSEPGISRIRSGEGFSYKNSHGRPIHDPHLLDRIHHLAIPPAYEKVWICADPHGHLQATGIDSRGRKQYRYHPKFRELQDETKFDRMSEFGKALPRIRTQIEADLSKHDLSRDKVLAAVVYLLDRSLIRVGNEEYVKQNKSYGLTTMLARQVRVSGQKIEFTFLGKSKTKHRIELHDRRLARIVKKIQDLPGQQLLHYIDDNGAVHPVTSTDVNAYIRDASGRHFTAKDFRTWWGTLLAFTELSALEAPTTKAGANHAIKEAIKTVASHLGNTVAVSRKSYVHPRVVDSFLHNSLKRLRGDEDQAKLEGSLIRFLADSPTQIPQNRNQ